MQKKVKKFLSKHNIDPQIILSYVVNGVNAQTTAKGYTGVVDVERLTTYIQEALPAQFILEELNVVNGDLEITYTTDTGNGKSEAVTLVLQTGK
jgi:hypothetical protein